MRGALAAFAAVLMCGPALAGSASFILGSETAYHGSDALAIARTVREASDRMLDAMARLNADEILTYYGRDTTYVGNGKIGNWPEIVAGTAGRYEARKSASCHWQDPFRIDLLSRDAAIVTAVLDCTFVAKTGESRHEVSTRLEVLRRINKNWTIIAVHEAS